MANVDALQGSYRLLAKDDRRHTSSSVSSPPPVTRPFRTTSAPPTATKSALQSPHADQITARPTDRDEDSIESASMPSATLDKNDTDSPVFLPHPNAMATTQPPIKPRGILKREETLLSSSEVPQGSLTSDVTISYTALPRLLGRHKPKRVSMVIPETPELVESVGATDAHTQAAQSLNDPGPPDTGDSSSDTRSLLDNRAQRQKRKRLLKLQSNLDFDSLASNELELKANLYFHICNPVKRWKVESVVPIKLILQLLKTFALLTQVILFTFTIAHQRSTFFYETQQVFSTLFIKDYVFEPSESARPHTIFTIQGIREEIEFIATHFYDLPNVTIGGYDFQRDENGSIVPPTVHVTQYREAILNASYNAYTLDGRHRTVSFCLLDPLVENVSDQFVSNTQDPLFNKFVGMRIEIPVKNIRVVQAARAECYLFTAEITFENTNNNGEVHYFLQVNRRWQHCDGNILNQDDEDTIPLMQGFMTALDVIVLTLCFTSLFLTFTTLRRAAKLGRAMGNFYKEQLVLPLSWWERRSLFSPWHLSNFFSDCLIISGTISLILLDFFVFDDAAFSRVFLGTALLFQAAVILRYVSYFQQLNALTRTLKLALPELLRFLLCALILFVAFSFCGWLVLGPFHPRFHTIYSTTDALFGLLNGDDIHETYVQISPLDNLVAYVYSRLFFYIFLILFIYAVLNLFTSLIISAYEESQHKDMALRNEVTRFIFSGPLTPNGVALRDVTFTRKYVDPQLILSRKDMQNATQDSFEYL